MKQCERGRFREWRIKWSHHSFFNLSSFSIPVPSLPFFKNPLFSLPPHPNRFNLILRGYHGSSASSVSLCPCGVIKRSSVLPRWRSYVSKFTSWIENNIQLTIYEGNILVTERLDPILSPGAVSGHTHSGTEIPSSFKNLHSCPPSRWWQQLRYEYHHWLFEGQRMHFDANRRGQIQLLVPSKYIEDLASLDFLKGIQFVASLFSVRSPHPHRPLPWFLTS